MSFKHCELVRSLRPPRRGGFVADLAIGFYLNAHCPMTYVAIGGGPDAMGWLKHFFVHNEGRLISIWLPTAARLFIWPVGQGPSTADSVARATDIWGRVPPLNLNALSAAQLARIYKLWQQQKPRPSCSQERNSLT